MKIEEGKIYIMTFETPIGELKRARINATKDRDGFRHVGREFVTTQKINGYKIVSIKEEVSKVS